MIEIKKTGICGSDVHYLKHGKIGSFILQEPMCLGHESSGVIVKLGPDVTKTRKLELGQRVALEPGVVCRVCEFCKAGQYEVSLSFVFQCGNGQGRGRGGIEGGRSL